MSLSLAGLTLLLALPAAAQTDGFDDAVRAPQISLGSLPIVGEDHPSPELADFPVTVTPPSAPVRAEWVSASVKWVRGKDGVAIPRGRLKVSVSGGRTVVRWRGRTVLPQDDGDGASVELLVPLLEGGVAEVQRDGKELARVRVGASPASAPLERRHAIDHSCSPYRLALSGAEDLYVSAQCRLQPVGRIGREEARLDTRLWVGGSTLPDGSPAYLSANLQDGRPAQVALKGPDGKPRTLTLNASLPPRLRRMRLAWGAGPMNLNSSATDGDGAAASLMLYGNFRLRMEDSLSVRFFEMAVSRDPAKRAFFNNLGVYFAYDAAAVLDNRLRLTALLGVQGVTFAPRGLANRSYTELIAPQGLEITYADAFGARNKSLSGGFFLLPTAERHYDNIWLRYGGRWFGELNYVSWRSKDRRAEMIGLSFGAPLAQLF